MHRKQRSQYAYVTVEDNELELYRVSSKMWSPILYCPYTPDIETIYDCVLFILVILLGSSHLTFKSSEYLITYPSCKYVFQRFFCGKSNPVGCNGC
jgi:hypothetical protein